MKLLYRIKTISDIHAHSIANGQHEMKKSLNVRDLTAMGIAAIVGAGIFSTIGNAAVNGGPAVSLLFVFTAVACGFSALCYAQFASSIPISGSAYTYAYASFGELIAWVIGWNLIMEYAVGNIAVAISWSDYFTGFLSGLHIHVPEYLCVDYLSASRGFREATAQLNSGVSFDSLKAGLQDAFRAWNDAPKIGNTRFIADIPAFGIVVAITWLVFIGIYESKIAGNVMVILKLVILFVVIAVGAFYVNPANWDPFAPNGIGGVLKGVSGVFFAYIGFDAVSTTAEECKNPRRDLPRAMIWSLLITTVLYVAIALVLTGLVHYSELGVGDPLAFAFEKIKLSRFSGFIAFSAIIAMASVLLVFQVGQPRIWMSMSRDGLLPKLFSALHRKYKTPWFSTIITGIVVAVPSLFMNLTEVTDLTSIGTLFAFALVSGGILLIDDSGQKGGFRVPFIGSRYFIIVLWAVFTWYFFFTDTGFSASLRHEIFSGEWDVFKHQIPFVIFLLIAGVVSWFSVARNLSLIPVLGLLTNLYLMSQLGIVNWMRFLVWSALGLALYLFYGYRKSKLNVRSKNI